VIVCALIAALTGAGLAAGHSGAAGEDGAASGASVTDMGSSGAPVDPALAQALRFAPPVSRSASYEIDFTDWARIESSSSLRLSANASASQQEAFLTNVSDAGVQDIPLPTTLFPFPALRWEATFYSDGPLHVAGFQPGFAMSHISDGLKRCGFASSSVLSFVIYAGSISQVFNCGPSGTGAVSPYTVYAVDVKDQVVVMSTTPSAVRAAITGTGLSSGSRPLADVLAPLSADPVLTIELGANYCKQITDAMTRHLTGLQKQAVLHIDPAGAPYAAFGLGYRVIQQPPTGQIVMDYADAHAASAQLSLREHLLKTEYSLDFGSPYSKLLALESAAAQGDNVALTVKPASGSHLELGAMWQDNDLAFARC
jgi:hypothetical protein